MTSSNPQFDTLFDHTDAAQLPLSPWLAGADDCELTARCHAWQVVAERGQFARVRG